MEESFRFVRNGKRNLQGDSMLPACRKFCFSLASEDARSFTATVKVLDDYFAPKTNVPFKRNLFRKIT